jgi:hypothetical protein
MMKKIVDRAQEAFTKRDTRTGSQPFSYNLIIRSGAERFTTKDELLKPHVQKRNMFSGVHDA